MKKLVLFALMAFGFSTFAQNNLTVTVRDSGLAIQPGVAVFYYSSPSAFFGNGYQNPPTFENYDNYTYTNNNGVANFWIGNVSMNDTVFWATKDCTGAIQWGAGSPTTMMPSVTGTLSLTCLPSDCEVILRNFSFPAGGGTTYIVEAISLLEFSRTLLPAGQASSFYLNGVRTFGFTSSSYDSISFNSANYPNGVSLCYARVDSLCPSVCDSIGNSGGSGGPQISCNANFLIDSLAPTAIGFPYIFRDNSTTNGTIISYDWDFGDSTFTSSSTPVAQNHTYISSGGFRTVCLTITSVLNADTCVSTSCYTVWPGLNSGGGNPTPIQCFASYMVDTVNSGLFQGQLVLWESSYSTGNIVNYSWDFGDGTTINAQYPSHTYSTVGVYGVCLTITAIDSAGIDTCVNTYCDSIGFDANGNLVYKGMTGFTINVIDPATVGLEDRMLESSLSLYPNPAAEKANLSWDASLKVQNVEVYSISGQKLIDFKPTSNTAEISGLESGAYLVRVSSKTASKTLRLIVE